VSEQYIDSIMHGATIGVKLTDSLYDLLLTQSLNHATGRNFVD